MARQRSYHVCFRPEVVSTWPTKGVCVPRKAIWGCTYYVIMSVCMWPATENKFLILAHAHAIAHPCSRLGILIM